MPNWLVVGLGSFLGGAARYALIAFVHRVAGLRFPLGTLIVNVVGCFLIGGVLHLVKDRSALGPETRLFVAVGLLGGFTTFSAFGSETFELLSGDQLPLALLNVAGHLGLGLGAVWLGSLVLRAAGL